MVERVTGRLDIDGFSAAEAIEAIEVGLSQGMAAGLAFEEKSDGFFVAATLVITYWASRKTKTTDHFYAAPQNRPRQF